MSLNVISARFNDLGNDGSPVRLGIMGGTFDPIHYGHLLCAEAARIASDLDAVLFIPTGLPNFKQNQDITPAQLRLKMCRIACEPNPHFDVSDIEITRGGVTYTIDTLRALRDHFPKNVELFFIMGTDSYLSLAQWREGVHIVELVHFIVVSRPGYSLDDAGGELEARFASRGYNDVDIRVDAIEAPSLDVSSSELRDYIEQSRPVRYLMPDEVIAFIRENKLYCVDESKVSQDDKGSYEDVFSEEFYATCRDQLATRVNEKRFKHVEGVAQAARMLAKTYGVDEDKAYLAGLLHDWDKGYDDEGVRRRIVELGLVDTVDPWVVEHMPQVLHGPTAAVALKRDFPAIPDDVIQAIDRHTTTAYDMSDLDKVLYIADAIEQSRQFGKIDDLRAMVGKASLDELFFNTFTYWTQRLLDREKPLHPQTTDLWNAHVALKAASKGK